MQIHNSVNSISHIVLEHWWETLSQRVKFRRQLRLICVIFCSKDVVRKSTPSRGSRSSSDQTPTKTIGKQPLTRSHMPFEGGSFPARSESHTGGGLLRSFISSCFSSVGVIQYFRSKPIQFSPDLITGIRFSGDFQAVSGKLLVKSEFFRTYRHYRQTLAVSSNSSLLLFLSQI